MKKIISIVLIISTLLLVGCQSNHVELDQIVGEDKSPGMVAVSGIKASKYDVVGVDIYNDTVTMLVANVDGDEENYYFFVIDAKKKKLVDTVKVSGDFNLEGISYVERDRNDYLIIADEYNKTAAVFDDELNFIGTEEYLPRDNWTKFEKNKFYNDQFVPYDSCARKYSAEPLGEYFDILVFEKEKDCFYLSKEECNDFLTTNDKTTVSCTYYDNKAIYKVIDYDKQLVVNETNLPYYETKDGSTSPIFTVINDSYIFTVCGTFYNDETSQNDVYVWDYKVGAVNKRIELKKYTDEVLQSDIDSLKETLWQKYKVKIKIDEDPGCAPGDGGIKKGADKLQTFIILSQINKFFSYFPDDLFSEICDEYSSSNQLDIYIVKDIVDDDSAAFANIWLDTPLICFSTDLFNFGQLPHEFMHILDIKLFNSYERKDKSFWDEWEKLNYEGFNYGTEDSEWEGKNQEYFVSGYSMTSQQEDRAEIFQTLFANYNSKSQFADHPNQQKKAEYLCSELRNAYKSLGELNNPIWEKSL